MALPQEQDPHIPVLKPGSFVINVAGHSGAGGRRQATVKRNT
jgi:hypothetical protein